MRRLEYSRAARADLAEIGCYIEHQSGSAPVAETFLDRLDEHCRALADSLGTLGVARPELGSDVRFTPFGSYSIFFRYRDGALEIINILESHRDVGAYFREGE